MMNIERIERELIGWGWNEEGHYLGNPGFGRIQLVAVCDDEGKEIYQQPVWLGQRGEVDVIVNDAQKIAFIEAIRHAVIPPAEYAERWNEWQSSKEDNRMLIPHPADLRTGVVQLEIPRGFTNVALREAEEEVRYEVELTVCLGHLNMDTAFFGTSPLVYVCRASSIPSDVPPDPQEIIRRVVWLLPEEAREVETLCGVTFSTLFLFRRWAFKQEDDFWREIGERL